LNKTLAQGSVKFSKNEVEYIKVTIPVTLQDVWISREILKLYRYSKMTAITSVIELRVIQLKEIFHAKPHATYLAAVH
jgi:hypothetical protein